MRRLSRASSVRPERVSHSPLVRRSSPRRRSIRPRSSSVSTTPTIVERSRPTAWASRLWVTPGLASISSSIPVRPGDTMLEALLRAGVAFPFSCQAGNCGTCKCELVSGDILELEHSEHALAPEQRAKGIILACRTQVWDDAVIRRIDAEDLVMHPSRVMRCRVLELEALTHDIRGVRLAIEAGGPLTFSAGQYAQLEFAPGLSRHYSMANTPHEPELVFH